MSHLKMGKMFTKYKKKNKTKNLAQGEKRPKKLFIFLIQWSLK